MSIYLRNRLCEPVRGYNRSIIYDLTRNDYFLIDNKLYEIISRDTVIYDFEIKGYKNFLLTNEIIFEIYDEKEVEFFPALNKNFESPYDIYSLCLDLDAKIDEDYQIFDGLLVNNLCVIITDVSNDFLEKILVLKKHIKYEGLFLFFKNEKNINDLFLKEIALIEDLLAIYIFQSKAKEINNKVLDVFAVKYESSFEEYIKNINPEKFRVNVEFYIENLNFNSYYNKKIFINKNGEISYSYNGLIIGKVKNIKTINNKYSDCKKDDFIICANCENRYMCLDSRVPVLEKDNWYYKEECSYNPFISKWNFEEGYLSLSEIGVNVYKNQLSIDKEILDSKFKLVWDV